MGAVGGRPGPGQQTQPTIDTPMNRCCHRRFVEDIGGVAKFNPSPVSLLTIQAHTVNIGKHRCHTPVLIDLALLLVGVRSAATVQMHIKQAEIQAAELISADAPKG